MTVADIVTKMDIKLGDETPLKPEPRTIEHAWINSLRVSLPKKTYGTATLKVPTDTCGGESTFIPHFILIFADSGYGENLTYQLYDASAPPTEDDTEDETESSYQQSRSKGKVPPPPEPEGAPWFSLEHPHVFMGKGQVAVLTQSSEPSGKALSFCFHNNNPTTDVMITVYWGLKKIEQPVAAR